MIKFKNLIFESPLVTIGLPFYNDASTLELAIKSVLAQTYHNWELILVDDGSSDGSFNIANKITDKRVRLISDGENKGLIFRLNQIASLANGKYLARMDADDLMDPTRIKKQIEFLVNNPDVDLVDTGAYSIYRNEIPKGKRGLNDINTNKKEVIKHAVLLHASVAGKKDWFLNNPYDEQYLRAEDYELWCRTFSYSKFSRIKEPLYIVREGKINIRNYLKSSKTIRKIVKKYGPGILSFFDLNKTLFVLRSKEFIYQLFSIFNAHHVLVNTRNKKLTNEEKNHVTAIINQIKKTKAN
ncbi:MAG TPA: glycosyltransferase family A protein [Parafilimonas sp.]|nr:glycosyltransferase family A protein [Parafilimonas sp.]